MVISLRPSTRMRAKLGAWRRDRRGSSFIEFGLLAPIYLLVIGAVIDIGRVINIEFNLSSGVSAAANFALNNAANATSTNGQTLATNLANIVASSHSTGWANATVVVNDGPSTSITNGGSPVTSGTAANANNFYCPTGSIKVGITWGSAQSGQGVTCTNNSLSGKFVVLTATKSFTALILPPSIIANSFTVSAVVQVQ
jgi:Flp pilus assembly protein TadG